MQEKGYVIVNVKTRQGYVVTDKTTVAKIINKTTKTIRKWFADGKTMHHGREWIVINGYEQIKSRRGWGSQVAEALTEIQDKEDF